MKEYPRPPTACPNCKRQFKAATPASWRSPLLALPLFLVAGAVTLIWFVTMVQWIPWEWLLDWQLMGRFLFVGVALAGLAPGLLVGLVACSLPRVRTLSCRRCCQKIKLKERTRNSAL